MTFKMSLQISCFFSEYTSSLSILVPPNDSRRGAVPSRTLVQPRIQATWLIQFRGPDVPHRDYQVLALCATHQIPNLPT